MKKLFSRADAVLIAVILLAAAAVLVFSAAGAADGEAFARIEKDGETIHYFRLSEDLSYREYEIGGDIPVRETFEKRRHGGLPAGKGFRFSRGREKSS